MKKIIFTFAILFSVSLTSAPAFSFFSNPHRIFELGFAVDAGMSNNYFSAEKILVKDLVIDLRKMADEMPADGLSFNTQMTPSLFMNLNLKNGIHAGFSTGIETYGTGSISKEFFNFLGYGNEDSLNNTVELSGNVTGDVFLFVNVSAGFNLFGFSIEVSPALVQPIIHAETTNMKAVFENNSKGSISAKTTTDVAIYSCINLKSIFDDSINIENLLSNIENGWSFDLSSSISRRIFNTLTLKAFSRIPIVPGTLKHSARMAITGSYETESIQDLISNPSSAETSFNISDKVYGTSDYKICRPLRMNAEAMWRPFGDWFTIDAMLGFGVRYPYTDQAKGYVEYNLGVDAAMFNILGIRLSTSYLNQVYIHQVGLMLNLRLIEVNAGISMQGADFSHSMKGSGLGATVSFTMGF